MFKVPSLIAQDLLMIQELLADQAQSEPIQPVVTEQKPSHEAGMASSSSDNESEEEIEADLVLKVEDGTQKSTLLADSSSDTSSDDSDSESESEQGPTRSRVLEDAGGLDEDDDGDAPGGGSNNQPMTKNEVVDQNVVVPDITEVGPDEDLEFVGEVMSIVDGIVIVQASEQASERALDADSLLVFEDRKVLGYVYETFGPTQTPLYQIKFTSSFPLDSEIVKISRRVFHVPRRSKFVFPSHLKRLKGSDASNLHDEEIADYEMEFSDDEAEARHKANMKAERRSRSVSRDLSAAPSRLATPIPTHLRDQDLVTEQPYGTSPYDEHGVYDMDIVPGPSRPPPIPYDDPYKEDDLVSPVNLEDGTDRHDDDTNTERRNEGHSGYREAGSRRGRGWDNSRSNGSRGKGRDRKRGRGRGGGFRRRSDGQPSSFEDMQAPNHGYPDFGRRASGSLSPTAQVIARATNQYREGSAPHEHSSVSYPASMQQQQQPGYAPWSYGQPLNSGYSENPGYNGHSQQGYASGSYQQYVQPHINPRFASMFGINMNFLQSQTAMYTQAQSPIYPYGSPGPANVSIGQGSHWSNVAGSQHGDTHVTSASTDEYAVKMEQDESGPL